ncbi:hypothetical protein [Robbsia andropogonis]|uniref:hypothetical protein n=1 Tax=Robbsia andropogonis TaxID=28092 RepID=UPI002A6A4C21|nr:hypothetical protein [Robbsia andropogonis]
MSLFDEYSSSPSQMAAVLQAGLEQISGNEQISFQQYTKSTLEADGYVFWVASSATQSFPGSLHVLSDRKQDEDQTVAANRFVFTSEQEISEFNSIAPGTMWIGTWTLDGVARQFAFAESGLNYSSAGIWHYRGFAVYPAMASQLVSSADDLPSGQIVSNSLPIWLAQNSIAPVYPSYLVPDNVEPPYVAVHIEPSQTVALQPFMAITWPGTTESGTDAAPLHDLPSWQLMRDDVRLILYGFTNQQAIQYLASLMDYSIETDNFGFCNSPAIRDEKRAQVEISAIAMKKTILIQASYYQATADAIARRLILSAYVTTTKE